MRGVAVAQARRAQRPQHLFDVFEPPRPDWRRVREHSRRIAVSEQAAADVPGHLRQLTLPGAGPGGERDLGADLVAEQRQQLVLVVHVPIERRRLDVESVGEPPHRQLVEPDFVQQRQRGTHDLRLIERLPLAAALGLAERDQSHWGSRGDASNTRLTAQQCWQ
jgi:hypothetical protein